MAKTKGEITDFLIQNFAQKMFDMWPDLKGISICGLIKQKYVGKKGPFDFALNGVFIKNKNKTKKPEANKKSLTKKQNNKKVKR